MRNLSAMVCVTVLAAVALACGTARAARLQPSDLEYCGAFRLPSGSGGSSWEYSGDAMAYFPDGDPTGPADGYPGSIFGVGHDWQKRVSEISIPEPVISPTKRPADLSRAGTLQPFRDVRAGVGDLHVLQELPRVGMEYLPAQGAQTSGKLYLSWGAHYQEDAQNVASHMWCDLGLTGSAGAWWVGDHSLYAVNDYMFEIPAEWAAANTPGLRLACGRYRDGGWGGQGPSLIAIGPWNHGNPPPDDAVLDATPLILYSSTATDLPPYHTLGGDHHSDEWTGGARLTSGDRAAVVFIGTKGLGDCWYGLPDGTVWPEDPPYPDDPEGQRGWWSTRFAGRMVFFDPDDLAAAASGATEPYQPQPYASLNIDQHLYRVTSSQQKYHTGAMAFDRQRGHLYVFEPLADSERSLIHVWAVMASGGGRADAMIRHRAEPTFAGNNVYNATGDGQTSKRWVGHGAKAVYTLRVQNDGPQLGRFRITGRPDTTAWHVAYFSRAAGGDDITAQVEGAGWVTGRLQPGARKDIRIEVEPSGSTPEGDVKWLAITASPEGGGSPDRAKARTRCADIRRPDALLRIAGSGQWVGEDIHRATGQGQTRRQMTGVGVDATYQVEAQNDGTVPDSLRVTGTPSDADWRVRYSNGDAEITAQVTGGGWTTPRLGLFGAERLRVSVKPRAGASAGAEKVVLVTAASVAEPGRFDVVRAITTADAGGGILAIAALTAAPTAQGAEIRFSLSAPAEVRARVLSIGGRTVSTLLATGQQEAGAHTLLWSGGTDTGVRAPAGRYLVEVTATSPGGSRSRALTPLALTRWP